MLRKSIIGCAMTMGAFLTSQNAFADVSPVPSDADFLGISAYVASGGHFVAYLVPEGSVGQDLDGDGVTNDTVLQYKQVNTNQVVNTGIPVYGFRIETDGSNILFLQHERFANSDLNNDGDRNDVVLSYYNIANDEVHYLPITPTLNIGSRGGLRSYDIHGPTISYTEREYRIGHDVTGDGDTNDYVLRVWDFEQQRPVDTGLAALYGDLSHGRIATTVSESAMQRDLNYDGDESDAVVLYYDLASQTYDVIHSYRDHNLTNPNSYPAADGWRIVYRAHERDEDEDLDGDGDIRSRSVLMTADLTRNEVTSLARIGAGQAWVRGDYVAYETSEHDVQQDINQDGDFQWDSLVGLTHLWTGETTHFQRSGEYVLGDLALIMRSAEYRLGETGSGVDVNGDGDTSDGVAYFVSLEQSASSQPPQPEAAAAQGSTNQVNPLTFLEAIVDGINSLEDGGQTVGALPTLMGDLFAAANNPALDDAGRTAAVRPILEQVYVSALSLPVDAAFLDITTNIASNAQSLLGFIQSP
ncbi:MAG: hypothetical protein GKR90_08205 [Pseudomonadales bacterium]|nr:hypothetical protein [Pseudomonadales bacterium]